MITPTTAVKVTVALAITILTSVITGTWWTANAFGEKADRSELKEAWGRIGTKADQQEVTDLTNRAWKSEREMALAVQRQEVAIEEIKKANKKLDDLMYELVTRPRRTGDASINPGGSVGSGSVRPGEGVSPGSKSRPDPSSAPSAGPNPLGGP